MFPAYRNSSKHKSKTGTAHHKHKRKGRQPANPGQPKEKKKSTWAAINEKNYLCNLCGKTLKGLTAYKRHQVNHIYLNVYSADVRIKIIISGYLMKLPIFTFRLFILVHDLMNVMYAERHSLKINV